MLIADRLPLVQNNVSHSSVQQDFELKAMCQFLAVSLGVDEKVSLQVHLKASNRFATRWVGDQSQFVENTSAEVISHDRETIIRASQLQGKRGTKNED